MDRATIWIYKHTYINIYIHKQIIGKGYYFAPDPRLADFFNGEMPPNKDKRLLLCRVACGAVATR